jgi:undecaprenyl pyrophosphate synthase
MEIIYTDKDGNTTKFTEEMAIVAITERDNLRTQLSDCQVTAAVRYGKNVDIRDKVREFFQERNDGDSDEITCTVDDVNELLRSIGSDELKNYGQLMAQLTLQ